MKLHSIDTGYFKLDGGAMFGVVPKVIWNKLNPADANNLCTWAMRCLLIEEGDRLILIDTGMGNKQSEKFFGYYEPFGDHTLLSSIKDKGFSPADITDVILTHLHFDHCGAAVSKEGEQLKLTFPNAIYWSNEAHWNAAVSPNPREKASFLKENILPIQESGQLQFADENTIIAPFINIKLVNGHTDAMMIPHIQYKDRTIVYMADLIPSSFHLPISYVMGYDIRPLDCLQEKDDFLKRGLAEKHILFFEHDPHTECCTLESTDRGIRMSESFDIATL
jgi:glyoxylase-like metal-dependent hydrolase (beta-lactamase superfamily II)